MLISIEIVGHFNESLGFCCETEFNTFWVDFYFCWWFIYFRLAGVEIKQMCKKPSSLLANKLDGRGDKTI